MRLCTRTALTLISFAALAGRTLAHDFWIEPESFTPKSGQILKVRLRVGDLGVSENVARDEKHILRFVLSSSNGEKPLVGRDGQEIAGLARLESEGTQLLGYVSNRSFVEMVPDKFGQYLKDKGLDSIAALREARGETTKSGRELYSRSSKSLIQVGAATSAGFDRMLDLPLELIPEKNPGSLKRAADGVKFEPLPVRLFFRHEPLANALVGALNLDAKSSESKTTIFARTDAEGRAHFELPSTGRWLLAVVHMVPAEKNDQAADWESFWGSLTFEVPAALAGDAPHDTK